MDTLLKNLTIKNNFMFAAVMSDEENCKGFLERVLPIKIDHVEISTENADSASGYYKSFPDVGYHRSDRKREQYLP